MSHCHPLAFVIIRPEHSFIHHSTNINRLVNVTSSHLVSSTQQWDFSRKKGEWRVRIQSSPKVFANISAKSTPLPNTFQKGIPLSGSMGCSQWHGSSAANVAETPPRSRALSWNGRSADELQANLPQMLGNLVKKIFDVGVLSSLVRGSWLNMMARMAQKSSSSRLWGKQNQIQPKERS